MHKWTCSPTRHSTRRLSIGWLRAARCRCPRFVMMRGVAALGKMQTHPGAATTTMRRFRSQLSATPTYPSLAGTDANFATASLFRVEHGEALHEELSLLVAAGLTPVEALRSATLLPGKLFDLGDRGVIETGRRADLLLVEGDPTVIFPLRVRFGRSGSRGCASGRPAGPWHTQEKSCVVTKSYSKQICR